MYASYLFNTYKEEYGIAEKDIEKVKKLSELIYQHEMSVVNYLFKDKTINDISANDLDDFIKSRVNNVLIDLGLNPIYEVNNNPIADWFYKDKESITIHDFFSTGTAQYRRNWKENNFSALDFIKDYK